MPSPPHATPCHRGCGSAVAPLCGAPSRTTVSLPGEMAASVTQEPRCSCSDMNGAHANTCSSPAACMVQGQRSTHAQGQGHCPQAAPPNPTDRQQQRGERGGGGGGGSGSATIGFSCQSGARTKAADKTHVAVSRPPLREHGGAEVVDAALDDHGQLRVCGVGLERRHDDRDACARHGRARQSASTARGQALCRTQSCCCCSSTCHTSAAAWQPARLQHSVTSATRSEARGRSMRQAAETKRKGRAGGGTRPGRCRARR